MKQGTILSFFQPRNPPIVPQNQHLDKDSQLPMVTSDSRSHSSPLGIYSEQTAVVDSDQVSLPTQGISIALYKRLRDPRTVITKVLPSHLDRLKSITTTLLPVRYSDRFFAECVDLDVRSVISFAALFESKPVGWIRCQWEDSPNTKNPAFRQVYIQVLGVLAPYRGIGLASALLESVISTAAGAQFIYAHVWENSEEALEWYDKHNFERVMLIQHYYRRLRPTGAWVVRKRLD